MPERAHVTSVEAIQGFRTSLSIFLSKARPALEEASGEVLRLRVWLENEQRPLWESNWRRGTRQLEEAEAALFSAKLSNFEEASAAQQAAVHKARRAVNEATDKLRTIKRWQRDYENRTEPLLKQQEKLSNLLALDIPNALATLAETIDVLQKYAGVGAPPTSAKSPPPAESDGEGSPHGHADDTTRARS